MNQPTKFSLVHVTRKRRNKLQGGELLEAIRDWLARALPAEQAWDTEIPQGALIFHDRNLFLIETTRGQIPRCAEWVGARIHTATSIKDAERWLRGQGVPVGSASV